MNKLFAFLDETITFHIQASSNNQESLDKPVNPFSDSTAHNAITQFIFSNQLKEEDILILALALVACVRSGLLRKKLTEAEKYIQVADFGCIRPHNQNSIFPTLETALFAIAGIDSEKRAKAMDFIYNESVLFRKGIVYLETTELYNPSLVQRLLLDEESLDLLTIGKIRKPKLSPVFPAQLIETSLNWENLILQPKTRDQIREVEHWLEHQDTILNDWGMKNRIKSGYRVLFHGAPGTGKSLTVSLLGKYTSKDVYRVDLSMLASKYIGETEKNLSTLFDKAANKDWILFFDEADSVFGKRTGVKDAHDKYANQEVSYLLQRIESHPGLVILASNFKSNIDKAFLRRFQTIVEFAKPSATERLLLWKENLPLNIQLDEDVSLENIAENYNVTGSNIVNIIQFICMKVAAAGEKRIRKEYLIEGIRREFAKEERMI